MPDTFTRPHREFFAIDVDAASAGWVPLPAAAGRIEERVLASSFDPRNRTGCVLFEIQYYG